MKAGILILSDGALRLVIKPETDFEESAIRAFFIRGFHEGGGGYDGARYFLSIDINDKVVKA